MKNAYKLGFNRAALLSTLKAIYKSRRAKIIDLDYLMRTKKLKRLTLGDNSAIIEVDLNNL